MYIANAFIFNDYYYYSLLGNQLPQDRIAKIIQNKNKVSIISYILLPLLLVIKLSILTCIIFTGSYISSCKITLRDCFKIILLSEFISILALLSKNIYLVFFPPENLNDMVFLYPLSISNVIDTKQIPVLFAYPLQLINLFEIAYWLFLILSIYSFSNKNFKQSFAVITSSYGAALVTWILIIIFFQLQFI